MRVRLTTVAVEKQKVLHILGVSSMQCAGAVLSSVACPALPYFSTIISKNGTSFGTEVTEHKNMWFQFHYNFCLKHFGRSDRDIIINVHRSSRKVPLFFLSDFNET